MLARRRFQTNFLNEKYFLKISGTPKFSPGPENRIFNTQKNNSRTPMPQYVNPRDVIFPKTVEALFIAQSDENISMLNDTAFLKYHGCDNTLYKMRYIF